MYNITIAANFAIEIRRGRCHILEFRAQRRALQQVQIAWQIGQYIVDEAYILAGGPHAGSLIVIELGILVHIRRIAVLHLNGQRGDGAEGTRLSAAISKRKFDYKGIQLGRELSDVRSPVDHYDGSIAIVIAALVHIDYEVIDAIWIGHLGPAGAVEHFDT